MPPPTFVPRPMAPFVPRFSLLREPDYRRFWLAALLDELGGWLLFAAQGWLLTSLTHSPRMVMLFFACRMCPRLLVMLPAGVVCDRVGPLPVLRFARLAGALPAIVVLAGALSGQLTVDLLLISALLVSVAQTFERPAHRSLLHGYASHGRLVGGVALLGTASTLAALTAPLLLLTAALVGGVLWALPLQIALSVSSGLLLFRNSAPPLAHVSRESVGKDCVATVRYIASTPALLSLIVLVSSPGMLDRLLTFVTPGYASGQGGGSAAMALLFLAPATGALIGGSLLAWVGGELRRLLPLALGSSSVAVVSVSLLATTRLFLLSLLLFLLLGAAKAAFSVAVMAALQRRVPDHARGRILAL
jgi:MFS transporter